MAEFLMDFNVAFNKLLVNEGGFTVDNGGQTKYGISKNAYPEEDIPNMTIPRAKTLYLRDYWDPARCDELPARVRFEMFDFAVNSSPRKNPIPAVKVLQRAAGLPTSAQDGHFGPQTLTAVLACDPWLLLVHFIGYRVAFYTSLRDALWDDSGKSWMNRIARDCISM